MGKKKIYRKKQVKEMGLGPWGYLEKGENIGPYSPKPCLPDSQYRARTDFLSNCTVKLKHTESSTKLALL